MELRDSPLWNEISAIAFEQEGRIPLTGWKAVFLADGKELQAMKVVSITIVRDFRQAYGDEITLEVMLPSGEFVYDIYPHRQDLKVVLSREVADRQGELGLSPDIDSQQLRATLIDDHSLTVEGLLNSVHSKDTLVDIMTVRFQLLDLALERVRLHSVGGLFRDATPAQVLEYILTSVSTGLDLDETNVIRGVEMVESPNSDAHRQIIIPHGTRFPELPRFLHERVGGIYPTGMGVYLFKNHWYVYPLFDLTRFDQSIKTLTLINLPKNQLPGVERTYRKTPHQVIALITGDVKHLDNSEAQLLNLGNGVRYVDARRVVDGFADTAGGDNKALISRTENNNEFVTDKRNSGLNNLQTSSARTTSNKFAELSKLAQRAGSEIQCVWENSDMGEIYPGMPVKYMYVKDDQIHELKGVVLAAQHYVQTYGVGITDSRHRTDTALHLFVSRETNAS